MRTLDQLGPGRTARVERVRSEGAIGSRLAEMGLLPGTEVRVVRVAPLGDPLEIELHGYHLSLRLSEARGVEVAEG